MKIPLKIGDFYKVQNFALKSLRWVTISYFYDSIDYSIENKIDEIYLTHFITSPDFLLDLISEYGFEEVATLRSWYEIT